MGFSVVNFVLLGILVLVGLTSLLVFDVDRVFLGGAIVILTVIIIVVGMGGLVVRCWQRLQAFSSK